MKKKYIVLSILVAVLVAGVGVYRFMYLPNSPCIGVLVSATSRLTNVTKVFANPCSVPFWYKDIRDYNPDPLTPDQDRIFSVREAVQMLSDSPETFRNQAIKIQAVHSNSVSGIGCNDYMELMDQEDAVHKKQLLDYLSKAEMDNVDSERIQAEIRNLPTIKSGETLMMAPSIFPTKYGVYKGHFFDSELSKKCTDGSARFLIEQKINEIVTD